MQAVIALCSRFAPVAVANRTTPANPASQWRSSVDCGVTTSEKGLYGAHPRRPGRRRPASTTACTGLHLRQPASCGSRSASPGTARSGTARQEGRGCSARLQRLLRAALPNLAVIKIKRGACGAAGPASAPASALEGPAGARRATPHGTRRSQQLARHAAGQHAAIFLAVRLSWSRPPRQGRAPRVARDRRSAAP